MSTSVLLLSLLLLALRVLSRILGLRVSEFNNRAADYCARLEL